MIYKAVLLGPDPKDELENLSKQLPEDPFSGITGYGGAIRMPVYSFEQLVLLAEAHPVHGAALEQKTLDIVSGGPYLIPEDDEASEEQRDEILGWLESLTDDQTLAEVLTIAELDHQTLGWGALEASRDPQDKVRKLFHVPGHTLRAHQDKLRVVQTRQGRFAWFKRWGVDPEGELKLLVATGRKAPEGTSLDKVANELLMFVQPSRRSAWYGVPNYVSALGHIALAVAARDYNIKFFQNSREPKMIYIVEGLDPAKMETMMDELQLTLRTQHKEPHRDLLLPLSGSGKLRLERVTAIQNDLHFTKLMEVTERDILIAHRVPPDRIGSVVRGVLGGNVAANINRIYKDAVVTPGQAVLLHRLNRFLKAEYARFADIEPEAVRWRLALRNLDLSDEMLDTNIVTSKVKHNLLTLNEGREALGLERREEFGDQTLSEYLFQFGGAAMQASIDGLSAPAAGGARALAAVVERMDELDAQIEELLVTGQVPEEGDTWGPEPRSEG